MALVFCVGLLPLAGCKSEREKAELRKCHSYERCKFDCPDGGTMKAGKTEWGHRKRFCEKNGKQHGLATAWYDNGQMEMKRSYKDDKLHGLMTTWHENGQMKSKTTWKNGKKQ
jgi:hypothetical protein